MDLINDDTRIAPECFTVLGLGEEKPISAEYETCGLGLCCLKAHSVADLLSKLDIKLLSHMYGQRDCDQPILGKLATDAADGASAASATDSDEKATGSTESDGFPAASAADSDGKSTKNGGN